MTEALWQRMDAIERFAADVAHEIKNPLTSLRSAVETAARVEDPAQQRRLMTIILDDVQRLDRLITDISDASRLDAELSRADAEPVDRCANCCARSSISTRRPPRPARRASCSMARRGRSPVVLGHGGPPRPGVAQPDRQRHLLQPAERHDHARGWRERGTAS